jgi:hypothetical protein
VTRSPKVAEVVKVEKLDEELNGRLVTWLARKQDVPPHRHAMDVNCPALAQQQLTAPGLG